MCSGFFVRQWDAPVLTTMGHVPNYLVTTLFSGHSSLICQTPQLHTVRLLIQQPLYILIKLRTAPMADFTQHKKLNVRA
jgi:hypothetical protein